MTTLRRLSRISEISLSKGCLDDIGLRVVEEKIFFAMGWLWNTFEVLKALRSSLLYEYSV